MKSLSFRHFLIALSLCFFIPTASAEVIYEPGTVTFDDLADYSNVGGSYYGFKWGSGIFAFNQYAVFSNNSALIVREDKQAFYFDGADFFLRPGADTNDFAFVLYGLNGETVYNGLTEKFGKNKINFGDPVSSFQAITETSEGKSGPAYSGLVTGVAIAWDNESWGDFGMDNFRFRAAASNVASVTAVPEPSEVTMLLLGILIILMAPKVREWRSFLKLQVS